jgi:putative transposase
MNLAMSEYKRPFVDGATMFLTMNLVGRGGATLVDYIEVLREVVAVLPDHMHAVWALPDGDADYSTRIAAIKAHFVMGLRRAGFSPPMDLPVVRTGRYAGLKPGLRSNKREVGVWQRRFYEHHIRDQRDFDNHIRYCWINPVKHGLCETPTDWPYSSIHRDVRSGRVDVEYVGRCRRGRSESRVGL